MVPIRLLMNRSRSQSGIVVKTWENDKKKTSLAKNLSIFLLIATSITSVWTLIQTLRNAYHNDQK